VQPSPPDPFLQRLVHDPGDVRDALRREGPAPPNTEAGIGQRQPTRACPQRPLSPQSGGCLSLAARHHSPRPRSRGGRGGPVFRARSTRWSCRPVKGRLRRRDDQLPLPRLRGGHHRRRGQDARRLIRRPRCWESVPAATCCAPPHRCSWAHDGPDCSVGCPPSGVATSLLATVGATVLAAVAVAVCCDRACVQRRTVRTPGCGPAPRGVPPRPLVDDGGDVAESAEQRSQHARAGTGRSRRAPRAAAARRWTTSSGTGDPRLGVDRVGGVGLGVERSVEAGPRGRRPSRRTPRPASRAAGVRAAASPRCWGADR
jgi:hypothetical protein